MVSATDPDLLAAWTQVFDQIETATSAAEAQLQDITTPVEDTSGPWETPTLSGPIPPELVARARDLWARQEFLLETMPTVLGEMRQHMRLIEKHTYATSERPGAIYLDIQA